MYKFIITLSLALIFVGCSSNETQEVSDVEHTLDTGISEVGEPLIIDVDPLEVSEITIRTTMTDEHPSVKVLVEREEIENLVNLINSLEGESILDDHSKGWQYWIIFDGYSISIMGNRLEMNTEVYRIDSLFYVKIKELYSKSIEDAKKYP